MIVYQIIISGKLPVTSATIPIIGQFTAVKANHRIAVLPLRKILICYRQHCKQRKAPVFKLLRGQFSGFSLRMHFAPIGAKIRYRAPTLKMLLTFLLNFGILTTHKGVSLARFLRNLQHLQLI